MGWWVGGFGIGMAIMPRGWHWRFRCKCMDANDGLVRHLMPQVVPCLLCSRNGVDVGKVLDCHGGPSPYQTPRIPTYRHTSTRYTSTRVHVYRDWEPRFEFDWSESTFVEVDQLNTCTGHPTHRRGHYRGSSWEQGCSVAEWKNPHLDCFLSKESRKGLCGSSSFFVVFLLLLSCFWCFPAAGTALFLLRISTFGLL